MTDELAGGAPAPAEPISAPVAEASPAPASIEDTMTAVWDRMNPARDEGGKFASTNPVEAPESAPEAEDAAQDTDQPEETAPEPEPPAIDAPNSWSAEMKAKFGTLPPEVREYIAQRESEAHKAITQKGEQVREYEPIKAAIAEHHDIFARNGVAPAEGLRNLMAAERYLAQQPVEALKWLANSYGVDLRQLATGQAPSADTSGNTEIATLKAELAQVKGYLTAQQRQQHEAERATLTQTIQDFAKDKPDFEELRGLMGALMQSGQAETLEDAYEKARFAHPTTRQRILEDQRKAEEEKAKAAREAAVAKAKKAAPINQKSAVGASPSKAASMEETMRAVADRLMG